MRIAHNTKVREDVREKENQAALLKRALFDEKQAKARARAAEAAAEAAAMKKLRQVLPVVLSTLRCCYVS
jgi:hypothetical protein